MSLSLQLQPGLRAMQSATVTYRWASSVLVFSLFTDVSGSYPDTVVLLCNVSAGRLIRRTWDFVDR